MVPLKSQKRKNENDGDGVNLNRTPQEQHLFRMNIVESQRSGDIGNFADTILICDGGTIRTHAFILQAASPFIHRAIYSQGENYPHTREIMLPDFSVNIVEKVLDLIYKGHVNLKNQEEIKDFQETLNFFEIPGVYQVEKDNELTKLDLPLQISKLNRIPDYIRNERKLDSDVGSATKRCKIGVYDSDAESEKTEVIDTLAPRTSSRLKRPVLPLVRDQKKSKTNESDDDFSYSDTDTVNGIDTDSSYDEGSRRKRRKPGASSKDFGFIKSNLPVIKLTRINAEKGSTPSSSCSASVVSVSSIKSNISSKSGSISKMSPMKPPTAKSSPIVTPSPSAPGSLSSRSEIEEEVETDEEDKDWVTPDYKNKEWLMRESHRCQICSKNFDVHSGALTCITQKHRAVRCYFCFKTFSATDVLFRHFSKRHKPSGRSLTTMCHFCDSSVPFKSVSCHVISTHLKTNADNDDDDSSNETSVKSFSVRPGRPCNGPITKVVNTTKVVESSVKSPIKKKEKPATVQIQRRIPDLNITLKKYSASGKVLTFHIKKKRNVSASISEN